MCEPKVFSPEVLKERKLAAQRERRALAKASGINIYAYKRMSPQELVLARKAYSELMKAWYKTEGGMNSVKDRNEKRRKYHSKAERTAAANAQKLAKRVRRHTNYLAAIRCVRDSEKFFQNRFGSPDKRLPNSLH